MLKLKLIRENVHEKQPYTKGSLFNAVTDEFICYTLEDRVRDYNMDGDLNDENEGKIYGETAIPYGTYRGFLRFSPARERVIPQLKNVKHFKYIQIHAGNNTGHTLGCILVGYNRDGEYIWNSREAETDIVQMIDRANSDGKFEIIIV